MKLSTTIGKIENIPNATNREILNEFLIYMKNQTRLSMSKLL